MNSTNNTISFNFTFNSVESTVSLKRTPLQSDEAFVLPTLSVRSEENDHRVHMVYVLRKLGALSFGPHLLLLLYKSVIQSILLSAYCSHSSLGMLTFPNKNKHMSITHTASKIVCLPTPGLSDVSDGAVTLTTANGAHSPLNQHFALWPSGRTLRQRRAPQQEEALNKRPRWQCWMLGRMNEFMEALYYLCLYSAAPCCFTSCLWKQISLWESESSKLVSFIFL